VNLKAARNEKLDTHRHIDTFTWEVGIPSSPVEFSSLCHSHKLSMKEEY
jgi:hypothetical protein